MLSVIYLYDKRNRKFMYDFYALVRSFTSSHVACIVRECSMEIVANGVTFKFTTNPDTCRGLDKRSTIVNYVH